MPFYINTRNENSHKEIARLLEKCIRRNKKDWSEIVFLCIGSDRVTGDCLGPYVGYRLSQYQLPGISVYGTLNQPVHAVNLEHMTDFITLHHPGGSGYCCRRFPWQKKSIWDTSPSEMVPFIQEPLFKKSCRLLEIFILQEL